MNTRSICPSGSDNLFGPQVNVDCRSLDFTLLFEDAILSLLPAALFLSLIIFRVWPLRTASRKLTTRKTVVVKLVLLMPLLVLNVAFTVIRSQNPDIKDSASTAADVVTVLATCAAIFLSILEDQRSVEPSVLLVLYFSASSLLILARLRTFWTGFSDIACSVLTTLIFILNVAITCVESLKRRSFLRSGFEHVTDEQLLGFWGRSLFIWVLPLFRKGYSSKLDVSKIPEVDNELRGGCTLDELERSWEKTKGEHRLLKATFRAYLGTFLSGVMPRCAVTGFTYAQPFLINTTIKYVDGNTADDSNKYGQALIGGFVLVYLGLAVSTAVYKRQNNRFYTKARAGLTAMIYRKTTELKAIDLEEAAAITLMSNDVQKIVDNIEVVHELWADLIDIAVGIILLERQVGATCITPVVISLMCIGGTVPIAGQSRKAMTIWLEQVQIRLKTVANTLSDMKAVKMLGFTTLSYDTISNLRILEVQKSEKFRWLLLAQIGLSNFPFFLIPFATLSIFAVSKGSSPFPAQAFTALSLISLMTSPLVSFCQLAPSAWDSLASFKRLQDYVLKKSHGQSNLNHNLNDGTASSRKVHDKNIELGPLPSQVAPTAPLVSFQKTNVSWSADSPIVLHELDLEIRPGFTLLVGPVGSGKSALINTMMGETVIRGGEIVVPKTNAAYCSQIPWIMNDSVRNNIVGYGSMDRVWYDTVISACGLEQDIEKMAGGDAFKAGSKGTSLSGGQRQRVGLARAVYSRLPVVILDDVFSGLDGRNKELISQRLFGEDGIFRTRGVSVVLATHTQSLLRYANEILVLDSGKIVDKGSLEHIISGPQASLVGAALHETSADDEVVWSPAKSDPFAKEVVRALGAEVDELEAAEDESSKDKWAAYIYYIKSAGWPVVWSFIGMVSLLAIAENFTTVWIQYWVDGTFGSGKDDLGLYIGVYAFLFAVGVGALGFAGWLIFVKIISNTATGLHHDLTRTTLNASLVFLTNTDVGSILNRFSSDMDLIELSLPMYVVNFACSSTSCLVQLVIICIIGKYLATTLPFLLAAVFCLQAYYLRTSRQIRILDIEARAPVINLFVETLSGMTTVRAFSWQSEFRARNNHFLDESQRPFYMLACIQQWLRLVLDLIVGAMAVILAAVTISYRHHYGGASVGVALNLILSLNSTLSQAITNWTRMETAIGAVTRTQHFLKETPQERQSEILKVQHNDGWPANGAIQFNALTAAYDAIATPVLKSMTLKIAPGEKIAVCGPSGSGKTSTILSILGMMEVRDGQLVVDGRDLAAMGPQDIRTKINVITQEPFFMNGTVRYNLDPYDRVPEDRLESALTKVGLWDKVGSRGGLDAELVASDLSAGERQLLALARALLVSSPILILDEATSNVDAATENLMQEIINQEFKHQTVVAVVHRLEHIDVFDRVVLMRNGSIIECDSPRELLGKDSEFRLFHSGR